MRTSIFLAGVLLVWLNAATADSSKTPAHLQAAEDIARHIAPEDNDYVYKDISIRWKGVDGATKYENHSDCSGFLDLLLEHTYAITPKQLKTWTGHTRPTAAAWYDAVSSGDAKAILTPLPTLDKLRPGDLILIKYPPGAQKDTGHVMIVDSEPAQRTSTAPQVPNTTQWDVRVIDSSKSGHGPQDTRHRPDGSFTRGVGIGHLRLYLNPDHSLAGYSWSTLKASKFEPVSEHPIILAHLTPQGH